MTKPKYIRRTVEFHPDDIELLESIMILKIR